MKVIHAHDPAKCLLAKQASKTMALYMDIGDHLKKYPGGLNCLLF